jgi:hypothetical protein
MTILRMVAMPGREFVAALKFSAVSSGVVAVQGMWMGRGTMHWYAMIGMWLGRVLQFEYSYALGVVSSEQIAVPFVFLFSFHVDGIQYLYLACHHWDQYIPKETLYWLMVGLLLLAPSWGP